MAGVKLSEVIFADFQLKWTSKNAMYTVRSKVSWTEFFYHFPSNAIYRAVIELRSWNCFSQECKLALV